MPTTYKASDVARAARCYAELAKLNPKWPQARVRKVTARKMGVETWVVRYLLRREWGVKTPRPPLQEGAIQ